MKVEIEVMKNTMEIIEREARARGIGTDAMIKIVLDEFALKSTILEQIKKDR